jgi:RimJ/RimL family protein N-acetyltransferase
MIKALHKPELLKFKEITSLDLELLMNWRMRPEVNNFMATSPQLNMDSQLKWFNEYENNISELRYMIIFKNVPIGSVFFSSIDFVEKSAVGPGWFIVEKKEITLNIIIDIYQTALYIGFNILNLNRLEGEVLTINDSVARLISINGMKLKEKEFKNIIKENTLLSIDRYELLKDEWISNDISFSSGDVSEIKNPISLDTEL